MASGQGNSHPGTASKSLQRAEYHAVRIAHAVILPGRVFHTRGSIANDCLEDISNPGLIHQPRR